MDKRAWEVKPRFRFSFWIDTRDFFLCEQKISNSNKS